MRGVRGVVTVVLAALLIGATSLARAAGPGDVKASLEKVTLKVDGMTCGGCEVAVKMAARRVDGVKTVVASASTGTAEVTFDPKKTTPDAIAKAIAEGSGFKVSVAKEPSSKERGARKSG